MTKRDELERFSSRLKELSESGYILADVRLVALLKTIAYSESLLALFKNCMSDFDYEKAKTKYLVRSDFSSNKGEFVLPDSSREILAFTLCILYDLESGKINFAEFLDKYFYVDGSVSAGYSAFIDGMIKPFGNTVRMIMQSVIDGRLQDPVEALAEAEKEREKEAEKKKSVKLADSADKKEYEKSVKAIKEILLLDKKKVKESKFNDQEKKDLLLVIDMFGSAVDSGDKDAITYAFASYKFATKSHVFAFFGRYKKLLPLIGKVYDGID